MTVRRRSCLGCRDGVVALLVSLVQGCSVEAFESASAAPPVVNTCSTQAECGANGQCREGMCVAALGQLDDVIVEIVPTAGAHYGAGDSFFVHLGNTSTADFVRDLRLPDYAEIAGRVVPEIESIAGCTSSYDAANNSLAVHVELSRGEASWGLPAASYEATSQWVPGDDIHPVAGWEFSLNVPTGMYDLYVTALEDCAGVFPPVLVRRLSFRDGGRVPYSLNVASPVELHGTVKLPEAEPDLLQGWTASILEPLQGRVVSTVHTWGDEGGSEFVLRYHPLEGGVAPLIRLAPPDGVAAPSFLWDLTALDLGGSGTVGLDLQALGGISPVRVHAQVLDAEAPTGKISAVAGASVRLRSLAIDGLPGLIARYDTTTTTDDRGQVDVELLPGRYKVVVVPPDESNLALTTDEWVIASTPPEQAGRTVEVTRLVQLTGIVHAPLDGTPLQNTTIRLSPTIVASADFLDKTISPPDPAPRPGSGYTDDAGAFAITVDPGSFDMAVQPRTDRALPWLVRSRLKVPNDGLGVMAVSLPVPIAGVLRDPQDNVVQQALLRVYAPLDKTGAAVLAPTLNSPEVAGVLQVAETRTDESGRFLILLPSATR